MTKTLSPDLLHGRDTYGRAAHYLAVGQIYFYDNPLLKNGQDLLEIRDGEEEAKLPAARRALGHRARCNRAERRGEYESRTETSAAASCKQPSPGGIR